MTSSDLSELFNEPIDMAAVERTLAKARTADGDRFHPVEDGAEYPSVTSVLSATLRAPALEHWKLKQALTAYRETVTNLLTGRETVKAALAMLQQIPLIARSPYARRAGHQDDAAEIGTRLHKAIEWALRGELGQDPGRMPDLRPIDAGCFARWSDWWATAGYRVLAVEVPLVCRACGFAGHADAFVEEVSTGDSLVLDWKTSKEAYATYRIQLAAYAHCSPSTTRGGIVRIGKGEDEPVELTPLDDLPELYPLFRATLDLWRWQRRLDGYYVGTEPINDHALLSEIAPLEPPATPYSVVTG